MAYCRNCGTQISDTAAFCSNCGCAVNMTNYNSNSPFIYDQNFANAPVNNGMATASMVLGILGVLFCSYYILGFPLNIIGMVLAVKSRKISASGKGTAGLVLTIIGLCFSVLNFIIYMDFISNNGIY